MRPGKGNQEGRATRSSSARSDGGFFHVRAHSFQSLYSLCGEGPPARIPMPCAVCALASSIPFGLTSLRPSRNQVSLGEALAALWNGPKDSPSILKPSTVERLENFTSGYNVGLISASRSDLTMEVNSRRWVELYAYIWPRFSSLDIDVRFSEHGPLQAQTLTERCYLLLGRGFDNGNLKGFLRQYGAIHDQGLVLYKPYDERSAYLLGTRNGVVPRRKQIVCIGEFRASRLPDYFSLIREQGSPIDVESMRIPIRKSFFNRVGGEY
jgi:hypothetical protein